MRKTHVETHEMIWNYELVYSIDREKLHRLILRQEFIKNTAVDQMFISGENGIPNRFGCTALQ